MEIPSIDDKFEYISKGSKIISIVNNIETQNIILEYDGEGDGNYFTVEPISFKAQKGEVIFVIGGNGSGKTTLMKLLTGL